MPKTLHTLFLGFVLDKTYTIFHEMLQIASVTRFPNLASRAGCISPVSVLC